jgi:hypothetical protein
MNRSVKLPLIYVVCLAIAGLFISAIGAWFSVTGLASLFAGAAVAVGLMAAGLEFAKLVIAAYLHRGWHRTHFLMRLYMSLSVVILSIITSLGVFGFLSNAYQKSSLELNAYQLKLESAEGEVTNTQTEVDRIQALIAQVPANQITKKIKLEAEMKPRLDELKKRRDDTLHNIGEMKLQMLQTHTKVGPLIFVSRAFHMEMDNVVKYLILIFVAVFDPLAICLVIALSAATQWREEDAAAEARGDFASEAPINPDSHRADQEPFEATMEFAPETEKSRDIA